MIFSLLIRPSFISFSFRRMVCRLGVCQLNSTDDKQRNVRVVEELLERGKEEKAQLIFLPEAFDYICSNKQSTLDESESVDGPLINTYRQLAKKHHLWLSLGGFHERIDHSSRLLNTHLLINDEGQIVSRYSKIHLFDVQSGSINYKESDFTQPGEEIVHPVSTPIGRLALGICYDLRFVEFSRLLSLNGAEILSYPSAFTESTGLAHWEILLRARAIENQCFVVAAAQVGEHPGGRRTFGHSMVVDPWGKILLDLKDEHPAIGVIDIDLQLIEETRKRMGNIEHRRNDLYQLTETKKRLVRPFLEENIRWGQIEISSAQVFFRTELSFATVNRKPVVKGHVLVSPFRCVERFSQLTEEEINDLFSTVQNISRRLEQFYLAQSFTISVQDGQFAGQTIRHVHVHILPRRQGDFDDNDTIYYQLSHHDRLAGGWRSEEEMSEEAASLRCLFTDNNA